MISCSTREAVHRVREEVLLMLAPIFYYCCYCTYLFRFFFIMVDCFLFSCNQINFPCLCSIVSRPFVRSMWQNVIIILLFIYYLDWDKRYWLTPRESRTIESRMALLSITFTFPMEVILACGSYPIATHWWWRDVTKMILKQSFCNGNMPLLLVKMSCGNLSAYSMMQVDIMDRPGVVLKCTGRCPNY